MNLKTIKKFEELFNDSPDPLKEMTYIEGLIYHLVLAQNHKAKLVNEDFVKHSDFIHQLFEAEKFYKMKLNEVGINDVSKTNEYTKILNLIENQNV